MYMQKTHLVAHAFGCFWYALEGYVNAPWVVYNYNMWNWIKLLLTIMQKEFLETTWF